jgi:hypothetical protein
MTALACEGTCDAIDISDFFDQDWRSQAKGLSQPPIRVRPKVREHGIAAGRRPHDPIAGEGTNR